jgi:hypothetical protein
MVQHKEIMLPEYQEVLAKGEGKQIQKLQNPSAHPESGFNEKA